MRVGALWRILDMQFVAQVCWWYNDNATQLVLGTGFHQETINMSMVTTFKFYDFVPPGISSC